MSTVADTLFPELPTHGMIFELQAGIFFKYDATTNAWIKISASGIPIPLATTVLDGAMTAVDLKKLNRLVIPPPLSSIIGTDCTVPFQSGTIGLFAGDKFVDVEGSVPVQNIDQTGELISKKIPFHIHQHTYGFDFTIDLQELVDELKLRNQFNITGKPGDKGVVGDPGEAGPDSILTGQPGAIGTDGTAPPCALTVEPDDLEVIARTGMTKALVNGRVVPDVDDPTKYKLVFDRQSIGPSNFAATQVMVQDDTSSWVLAITGNTVDGPTIDPKTGVACDTSLAGGQIQSIYYIDVESLVGAVHQQFLAVAQAMKIGYETIVRFWIQTMSDLFDEQKSALCCALEHCMSIRKNIETREHMEDVAASAAGSANILLHSRESNEAVTLSSTRILQQLGGTDPCKSGPRFPHFPNLATGGVGGFGPAPSTSNGSSVAAPVVLQPQTMAVTEALVTLDPLVNSALATAVQVPMAAGDYTASIRQTTAAVGGKFRANARLQFVQRDVRKSIQFLDKGEFQTPTEAKHAYEGLSLAFHHDGGMISLWLPALAPQTASGALEIVLQPVEAKPVPVTLVPAPQEVEPEEPGLTCQMSVTHLAWYERSWQTNNCCGLVINVMGQDYIIIKRSVGLDAACGGGEAGTEPCIERFTATHGHPAFAWPTFDGQTFAPLPNREAVTFHYDETLNDLIADKIAAGDFTNGKGMPAGVRHLTYQLTVILFPAN